MNKKKQKTSPTHRNEDNPLISLARQRSEGSKAYYVGTIMGITVGALFCIAGFTMAVLGLSGSIDWVVESSNLTSKLTNASPGVVFGVIGLFVLWRYRPKVRENLAVDDKSLKHTTMLFRDNEELNTDKGTPRLPIGPVVTIPDQRLEAALRDELNKPDGEIGALELESITGLDLKDRGICDLTGVEYCKNLEILSLENNNVSDVRPLRGLSQLRVLSLNTNPVSDVSELADLTNLTELYIGKTNLSDLTPLIRLTKLKMLSLVFNQIEDVEPLLKNASSLGLGKDSKVLLWNNPLSWQARNVHIPMIKALGVDVGA
jgi:hypothetical protein